MYWLCATSWRNTDSDHAIVFFWKTHFVIVFRVITVNLGSIMILLFGVGAHCLSNIAYFVKIFHTITAISWILNTHLNSIRTLQKDFHFTLYSPHWYSYKGSPLLCHLLEEVTCPLSPLPHLSPSGSWTLSSQPVCTPHPFSGHSTMLCQHICCSSPPVLFFYFCFLEFSSASLWISGVMSLLTSRLPSFPSCISHLQVHLRKLLYHTYIHTWRGFVD